MARRGSSSVLAARRRDAHVRADFSHSLARLAPRPAWYAPPDAAPPLLPPRSHCCWSAADAACGATPRRQLVRIDDAARTSCVVCQVQSNASLVTVRAVGSGLDSHLTHQIRVTARLGVVLPTVSYSRRK